MDSPQNSLVMRVGHIRVPNLVAYPLIGLGVGLITGILVASEHGRQVGGHLKDGEHLMRVEAHKYSRTTMPVGAITGTVTGAVVGCLVNLLTRIRKRSNAVSIPADVEDVARSRFAPAQRQENADAIRVVDKSVREDERECTG